MSSIVQGLGGGLHQAVGLGGAVRHGIVGRSGLIAGDLIDGGLTLVLQRHVGIQLSDVGGVDGVGARHVGRRIREHLRFRGLCFVHVLCGQRGRAGQNHRQYENPGQFLFPSFPHHFSCAPHLFPLLSRSKGIF